MSVSIKRALISVSNKIGIVKFAQVLQSFGVEIVSTGGTYSQLSEAGIKVSKVEELTNFPEMMNGRLKTLHPFVHGAILADRTKPEHIKQAADAGMKFIDMVVVNLYPFKETVSRPGVQRIEAIENIDIGGPTMIRSAAKNHKSVAVVVDPEDYEKIAGELSASGGKLSEATLFNLAVKAFQHTCEYDSVIFNYFINEHEKGKVTEFKDTDVYIRPYLKIDCTKGENDALDKPGINVFRDENGSFSQTLELEYKKIQELRYGENPHQKASYYRLSNAPAECLANSIQLQGKELSYNNILDANAAFAIVKEFEQPCVAIIKHNNPCGVSSAKSVAQAYTNAHLADPLSAFGGIVACNYMWTADAARFMSDKFTEVLIAPDFEPEALEILKSRENLRILKIKFDRERHKRDLEEGKKSMTGADIKSIDGGLLVQDLDEGIVNSESFQFVTDVRPTDAQLDDLAFAWQIIKNVKSNSILLVNNRTTCGVGAGQMSRVDSTKIAVEKAGDKAKGAVLASDAYFPFTDGVEIAINAGISAIIQPGGSVRDREIIELCNKRKVPMVFTGKRHFKH